MDALESYTAARQRFNKLAGVSSGLILVGAGASRLPTWEVSSPVGWLVGSVNVGFVPIFGPILIVGAVCNVYLALRELVDLRAAVLLDTKSHRSEYAKAILKPPRGAARFRDGRTRLASWGIHLWNFWVPVLAYAILVSTYFDFVRPTSDQDRTPMAHTETSRILDLLVGTYGWSGFQPTLPSIHDNLLAKAKDANKPEEAARLRQLADAIPWIYPPFQTWAYLLGFALLLYLAIGASKIAWDTA